MIDRKFDRLNEQGRKVMNLAAKESQQRKHYYIGPEHIFLAILHPQGGDGAYILRNAGLNLEIIRDQVESLLTEGTEAPTGSPELSPRAHKAIQFAISEAESRGVNSASSADLLIGLLEEHTGIPADVLREHHFELNQAREELRKMIGHRV